MRPDVVIYGSWLNACRQGSKWETALTILAEMSQEYARLFLGMKVNLRERESCRRGRYIFCCFLVRMQEFLFDGAL